MRSPDLGRRERSARFGEAHAPPAAVVRTHSDDGADDDGARCARSVRAFRISQMKSVGNAETLPRAEAAHNQRSDEEATMKRGIDAQSLE